MNATTHVEPNVRIGMLVLIVSGFVIPSSVAHGALLAAAGAALVIDGGNRP